MNYLSMLEKAPESHYFLSILACGTTFRETNQESSNQTYCNDLSNIIGEYVKKNRFTKNEISFEQITQAIEKCLEQSENVDAVSAEDLSKLALYSVMGTKEQREDFGYNLIKKFKDIDITQENLCALFIKPLPHVRLMTMCSVINLK